MRELLPLLQDQEQEGDSLSGPDTLNLPFYTYYQFYSLLYFQYIEQCLIHSRCSINVH